MKNLFYSIVLILGTTFSTNSYAYAEDPFNCYCTSSNGRVTVFAHEGSCSGQVAGCHNVVGMIGPVQGEAAVVLRTGAGPNGSDIYSPAELSSHKNAEINALNGL